MKNTPTRVTKTKARGTYRADKKATKPTIKARRAYRISKKIPTGHHIFRQPKKLLPEQIYRLLGSSIGDLLTLSDAKQLREIVRWFADSDAFWELAPVIALKSQQACEEEIDGYLKLRAFRTGRARRARVINIDSRRVRT